jgi:hypothetical protein
VSLARLASVGPIVAWLVSAAASGVFGLVLGGLIASAAAKVVPAH